jgi:hypothetical protein
VIHPYLPTHWWLSFDSLSACTHVIAAIEEKRSFRNARGLSGQL